MRENSLTVFEDEHEWQILQAKLKAALETPFTFQSRESTKAHHAEFSFLEAMALAADGGTIPLARFIRDRRGRNLLSELDWQYLAVFIRSLWRTQKMGPGRPKYAAASDGANAEAYAARLVARSRDDWRALNARKRVPADQTNKFIALAIKKAAADYEVSEHKIKSDNIRNLLKAGRA